MKDGRGVDCDIDHYLVVTEVRERLSVSKRAAQKFDKGKAPNTIPLCFAHTASSRGQKALNPKI
jgi:hypothetical protein